MGKNEQMFAEVIGPYITGEKDTCSYCDHLDPLILIEGIHTYITLAIGQIIEGYTQVCTQKHRTAATGLFPNEAEELVRMKDLVRETYDKVYGNPGIAFEHGKAGTCLWKENREKNMHDLCHHTHIHFVPVDIDIRSRIARILPDVFVVNNLAELGEVRKDILEGAPYLYFENSDGVGYVYPVGDNKIPRQFLRQCVAEELNMPERADWMKYPGTELFAEGKKKLLPVMNQIFKNSDVK